MQLLSQLVQTRGKCEFNHSDKCGETVTIEIQELKNTLKEHLEDKDRNETKAVKFELNIELNESEMKDILIFFSLNKSRKVTKVKKIQQEKNITTIEINI